MIRAVDSCVIVPIMEAEQSELSHYASHILRSTASSNTSYSTQDSDLTELKKALGTTADLTVFRKLRQLGYLSSYTHRGRFYTLRRIARFDSDGLWSHQDVWFSSQGTLLATCQAWINRSAQGCFAEELAGRLHADVQDTLHELVRRGHLLRTEVNGLFLYTSPDGRRSKDQVRTRLTAHAVPMGSDPAKLHVSPDELKAANLLFYSLLDEQQRRLYAGLESMKLGRGGDAILAGFLHLDPHTVARGRQQLLEHDVSLDHVRRSGGGRTPVEKKRQRSSS